MTPKDFGRIAAQTFRQVMTQRIREAERELKYEEYAGREGDIVTAESLERLNAVVDAAGDPAMGPAEMLEAKASAWFGFYAVNPRDLDLGFYLVQGMRPRGMSADPDVQLNDRLHDALRPCEAALQAMGLNAEDALRENTALFAHGVGLLLLQHTGRIRMFGQDAMLLFDAYVIGLVERLQRSACPA